MKKSTVELLKLNGMSQKEIDVWDENVLGITVDMLEIKSKSLIYNLNIEQSIAEYLKPFCQEIEFLYNKLQSKQNNITN